MAHPLLTRLSTFYFHLFFLSVPVFLFHLELFLELHYTIVMANLRCSAAEESEDTLNVFTPLTRILQNFNVLIAIPSREISFIYCSCGRNLKYKRSPITTQKANNDYTSIPYFVILKISSRGPEHGQSERQIMFFKAKEMIKKARQEKHGSHPTILSRWHDQEGDRRSLADHNIGEKEIMLYETHRS